MTNELKEILDRLKDSANNPIVNVPVMGGVSEPIDNSQCLEPNECKLLLDYITNLQEENKRLKQSKKETLECLKEFHNYENRFKWCEEDYIDTIKMFEKKLQGEDNGR